MPDLSALYREVILDHGQRPRNYGRIPGASASAAGDNPLCGDRVRVDVVLAGAVVADVRFEGVGCVIATASASLMTEVVRGKRVDEIGDLAAAMDAYCGADAARDRPAASAGPTADHRVTAAGPAGARPATTAGGDRLAVFAGVRRYPLRAKCATLAWRTLVEALAAPPAAQRHVPADGEMVP